MSQIDDSINAVKKHYPEESAGAMDLLVDVLAVLNPFVGVAKVFHDFRSKAEQQGRIRALFKALEWYIRRHEKAIEDLALETQLQRPEAKEAVIAAVTESLLSPDENKIRRFAAILGHEFVKKGNKTDWEDAAAYIRDLAQLGDSDIRVLRILHDLQRSAFIGPDEKPDQPQFARTMERALLNAGSQGISREDFYSRCARLNGFGLTLQMERPRGMAAVEYVYRLTRHGKRLIDILQGVG